MSKLENDILFLKYLKNTANDEIIIKFLKSRKCTKEMVNYQGRDGWTTLMLASKFNCVNIVSELINLKVDVNAINRNSDQNALMYCIADGGINKDEQVKIKQLKVVRLLINAGTNLNYGERFSAFTIACEVNNLEVIKEMLNFKIDVNYKDEKGMSGKDYLIKYKNKEGVNLIEKYLLKNKLDNNIEFNSKENVKNKV